jgi:hypothetical protein
LKRNGRVHWVGLRGTGAGSLFNAAIHFGGVLFELFP